MARIYIDNESLTAIFNSDFGLEFECTWLPEDKYDWFCEIIEIQLKSIVKTAKLIAINDYKKQLRAFLE